MDLCELPIRREIAIRDDVPMSFWFELPRLNELEVAVEVVGHALVAPDGTRLGPRAD